MTPRRPGLKVPSYFTFSATRCVSGSPKTRTKEELLDIVGHYDDESAEDHFEFLRDIYRRGYPPPNGPNVTVSDAPSDVLYPSPYQTMGRGLETAKVQKLRESLYIARVKPEIFDPQAAYDIYLSLPEPRMLYISGKLRHILMSQMVQRPKNYKGMLRYFSLVSDIKECGLSLLTSEWNTAISYASRYVGSVTESETEAALKLWKEMSNVAGIKATDVTFNIMFDVASKSGNFALAEMIYKEMIGRGLTFNRYHHVSLIHFFGLKMDSGGVRAAYREMVETGEMIDSTVLNSVISALLRCGEEGDAERIYDKMKCTHPAAPIMTHRTYFKERVVTKVLMMFAEIGRRNKPLRPVLQAQSSITPTLQTYRILINHYAHKVGDLQRVTKYLDEMQHFDVPLHGAIFLTLFKAFHEHGGFLGTEWTAERLDHVFASFLSHYDRLDQGLYINKWMAMWILKAFARSFRSKEKVVDVFIEIKIRAQGGDVDIDEIEHVLHKTLKSIS
ncbi:uncharacterized protein MKZ38_009829 [Zalerion maritima]|uniref:Pentatricopeptide repeat-containing protein n=1 Tax=Zalerion maritima TaxID=339359 RepID=A0AAD5WXF0_9PEZI|nr:uncharacterized protein MKZ38_009829 [Zalerion maritima]